MIDKETFISSRTSGTNYTILLLRKIMLYLEWVAYILYYQRDTYIYRAQNGEKYIGQSKIY